MMTEQGTAANSKAVLAAWIRQWRQGNRASQRALALRAGVSQACIYRLVARTYQPTEATVRRLAKATGTDIGELCRIAGVRAPQDWLSNLLDRAALRLAYIDEQRSLEQIAAERGVTRETVAAHLRRSGITIRRPGGQRRYGTVNAAHFAEPQNDLHAYWLGFLAADGCVFTAAGRNVVRLRLAASDADHVQRFAEATGAGAPVVRSKAGYAEVTYNDAGLVAALAAWGIVAAKTLTIAFPDHLPGHLKPAFVRGYFDGDGSIYWRKRGGWRAVTCKFVSGSQPMLNGLQILLNEQGVATAAVRPGSGRALVLPVLTARPNLRRFAECLYKNATVWLPRKRVIFEELGVPT